MKSLTILIITLFLHSCSPNHNIDLIQTRLKVDYAIASKSIDIKDSFYIEENEDLILSDIWSIDINHQKGQMIIGDDANRSVNLYDYKNGKILSYLKDRLFLSDSVAVSNRVYLKSKIRNYKNYKYIKLEEYPKYGLNREYLSFLGNTFYSQIFINDKIYILTHIYCQSINTDDNYDRVVDNRTAVLICNQNLDIERIKIFEVDTNSYTVPYLFHLNLDEGYILASATDFVRWKVDKKFDYLPVITKYNLDGDIQNISFYLTDKYVKSQIGYSISWLPTILEISGALFFTLKFDLSVYGINNEKKFDLQNLPFTNDTGFALCKEMSYQLSSYEIANEQRIKNINTLFPVQIVNTFKANNNILIQILIWDESIEIGYYYLLQEYSAQGKLLSQTSINDDINNRIKYMMFDDENKYLLLFKKSKTGWTLEKREWL